MKKYYKLSIEISDGQNINIRENILAHRILNGYAYQEIVTGQIFTPLFKNPIYMSECFHNFLYNVENGEDVSQQMIETTGISMMMYLDDNRKIEQVLDFDQVEKYYNCLKKTYFYKYHNEMVKKYKKTDFNKKKSKKEIR